MDKAETLYMEVTMLLEIWYVLPQAFVGARRGWGWGRVCDMVHVVRAVAAGDRWWPLVAFWGPAVRCLPAARSPLPAARCPQPAARSPQPAARSPRAGTGGGLTGVGVGCAACRRDYRTQTDDETKAAAAAAAVVDEAPSLPEPPMVRENLEQEIRFLVSNLEAKGLSARSAVQGNDAVIDYITDSDHSNSSSREGSASSQRRPSSARPQTARTSEGRIAPLRDGGDLPLTPSTSADAEHKVGEINGSISCFEVGTVVESIREALRDECEKLLKDAEFLQTCLQDEHDYKHQTLSRAETRHETPSIYELRQCRSKLERSFLQSAGKARPAALGPATASLGLARPVTPAKLNPLREPPGCSPHKRLPGISAASSAASNPNTPVPHPPSPRARVPHRPAPPGAPRTPTNATAALEATPRKTPRPPQMPSPAQGMSPSKLTPRRVSARGGRRRRLVPDMVPDGVPDASQLAVS